MSAASWRPALWAWLADHHGVVSRDGLAELGCGDPALRRLLGRGELVRILPGTYRAASHPLTSEARMSAACQRNPLALVAFVTAGRLWKLRKMSSDQRLHLLVPHRCSPEMDGIVIHQCRRIDAVDIVTRDDGIKVTSPPRTIFDAADMLGVVACASALEQVLDQYCTLATIVDTVVRLGHPRRPGTRTLRRVLASRPQWQEAVQSDLEQRVLVEIRAQRLPEPSTQYSLDLPNGRRVRLDFAWPEQRVALEVDHPFWHAFALATHEDKHRDRKAATVGWLTIRITDLDLDGQLREAVADVKDVLRLR